MEAGEATAHGSIAPDGVLDAVHRLDDDVGSFVGDDEVERPFAGPERKNADRLTVFVNGFPYLDGVQMQCGSGCEFHYGSPYQAILPLVFHSERKRNKRVNLSVDATDKSRKPSRGCGELRRSFVMEPGWRLTWEDSEEDYVYCDGTGQQLGRAYYSPQNQWRWFFAGMTGRTDSRREALLAVELAYERRARFDGSPKKIEIGIEQRRASEQKCRQKKQRLDAWATVKGPAAPALAR
jgi:hypothetical protein